MKQIFSIHATNKELALRKAPIQQLVKHNFNSTFFFKDMIINTLVFEDYLALSQLFSH